MGFKFFRVCPWGMGCSNSKVSLRVDVNSDQPICDLSAHPPWIAQLIGLAGAKLPYCFQLFLSCDLYAHVCTVRCVLSCDVLFVQQNYSEY